MALNKADALRAKQALEIEMKAQGLPLPLLSYSMLQLAHETAGFQSRVSKVNNLSGIKYSKNGFGYDSGIKPPANEGNTSYAGYKTYGDWAKDYLRIIKRMGADKATSLDNFSAILKKGGYYTDSQSNYIAALKSWLPQMKSVINTVLESVKNNPIKTGTILIFGIGIFLLLNFNK